MAKKNQTAIVCKTVAGDCEAFEQLLAMKKCSINCKIQSMIGNPNDIEDVAQEVAIRLFQRIGSLKDPEAFNGWLNTIVTRECLKYFATQSRLALPEGDCDSAEFEDRFLETDTDFLPSAYTERIELHSRIKTAIDNLPEPNRRMLLLHYEGGKCYREIAAIMGISIGVVCSYLYRTRKRLRKELMRLDAGYSSGRIAPIAG